MVSTNLPDKAARTVRWFGRAREYSGTERHAILLVLKSALAAAISWGVAYDVMSARAPAFAPFSAVLMMQVTVYQSVVQSLRYVAAVGAGVVLQGLLALALGANLLTFALMAVVALTLSRWPRLGSQGTQVSTAAFFAFSVYVMATQTAARFEQLGQVLLLVLTGCAAGVAVNVLVFPPMRYRGAAHGIQTVCRSMSCLLGDMADGIRKNELEAEHTGRWRHRAGELEKTVAQTGDAVATARESTHFNPRRIARRRKREGFSFYGAAVGALDRMVRQLDSITRSFDLWHEKRTTSPYAEFLRDYADCLDAVAGTMNVLCELGTGRPAKESPGLRSRLDEVEEARSALDRRARESDLPLSDHTRPYGVLVMEATRLLEELEYTHDVFCQREKACQSDEAGRSDESRAGTS